ncbi:4'-phosphopantetheinyl transferase family protein [Planktotalea sp.]|uniref:4'-phosphopantetheinyl transferase family protein n=1 Tax=Planktotalea sp. TaxID=2029877 RepID=UPI003D6B2429
MSLLTSLEMWLPKEVGFAVRNPSKSYPLHDVEKTSVAHAIPKRKNEFSAGRDAAREVLSQFGLDNCSISVGEKRAPVWPDGFCGSITHSDEICIAAIARQGNVQAIGIDAEPDLPLRSELHSSILHSDEFDASAEDAIAIFSKKEALFKMLFPLTGLWMGFHDAKRVGLDRLELTRSFGRFTAGMHFHVPTLRVSGHVISFCKLEGDIA